ncbi:hypothetical protein D9757_009212 [Collybiopsis confluens]|uniref:Uncharacterized protein n=1 Tax=Collybiopsis confluens TaxID=2823264 RepID=A0A8H5HA76_9AGAR|nr:hypothetical protein D9757_009212 [Collybiopsis confluens]
MFHHHHLSFPISNSLARNGNILSSDFSMTSDIRASSPTRYVPESLEQHPRLSYLTWHMLSLTPILKQEHFKLWNMPYNVFEAFVVIRSGRRRGLRPSTFSGLTV